MAMIKSTCKKLVWSESEGLKSKGVEMMGSENGSSAITTHHEKKNSAQKSYHFGPNDFLSYHGIRVGCAYFCNNYLLLKEIKE